MAVALAGLAAYAVLAGADFGAGFWQLTRGSQPRARAVREHAHHAIGPVWEANHVWLIFVLVVVWTAYPRAFGSIASTLAVPLFVAGIGIVLRGTAYALRSGTATAGEERRLELLFAASSILTPFALGAAIGGIASGRVPVGNASGDLLTSWVNPTSVAIGCIAVATSAYLAAVYLAADARRLGRPDVELAFRVRALLMAGVAGAAAVAGLVVVHEDARPIWEGLAGGGGLAAVVVSALAGVGTVALVEDERYAAARATAAVAVAAVIAGWGLAQRPRFLPGLTIEQAAAGRSTLVWLLASLAAGALVLVPSLVFLFTLFLRGRFDEVDEPAPAAEPRAGRQTRAGFAVRAAAAAFVVGAGLMLASDSRWTRIAGVGCLLFAVAVGFVALASLAAAAELSAPPSVRTPGSQPP